MISLQAASSSSFLEAAYRINNYRLNDSMLRVSTGKRLMQPIDDVRDYFHTAQLKSDLNSFTSIQSQISLGQGFARTAEMLGNSVLNSLQKMEGLLKQYYNEESPVVANSYFDQFNAVKSGITSTIANCQMEGKKVMADGNGTPALKVQLDPRDISITFNIEYGAAETVDASGLKIGVTDYATESAALQNQIDKAFNYLARTAAYIYSTDSYSNLTNKKMQAYMDSNEQMESIDSGLEMSKVTKSNLAVQMSVSMMAQGNMMKSSVLNLLSKL